MSGAGERGGAALRGRHAWLLAAPVLARHLPLRQHHAAPLAAQQRLALAQLRAVRVPQAELGLAVAGAGARYLAQGAGAAARARGADRGGAAAGAGAAGQRAQGRSQVRKAVARVARRRAATRAAAARPAPAPAASPRPPRPSRTPPASRQTLLLRPRARSREAKQEYYEKHF